MNKLQLLNIQNQVYQIEYQDEKLFVVLHAPLITGLDNLLVKNDLYSLGFVSTYEIRAGHEEGIIIGYAFNAGDKDVKFDNNYLIVTRGNVNSKEAISMEAKLEMRFKMSNITAFSTMNIALVTVTNPYDTLIKRVVGR